MSFHASHWSSHLLSATRGLLYSLIFLFPPFFLPFTLDTLELNKQTLLLILTFSAALTWIGSMLLTKRFAFRRGWIQFFPLALVVVFGISAWFSSAPFLSWIGGSTQEYTSFLTIAALSILFYLVVNVLDEQKVYRRIQWLLIASAVLVAAISLTDLFVGKTIFNTIGTLNAVGIFLVVVSLFALSIWISQRLTLWLRGLIVLLSLLTFAYLAIIDYWLLWLLLEVGLALMFAFVFFRARDFSSVARFILPVLLFICALPFWLWLGSLAPAKIPAEVTLNQIASQEIVSRALETVSSFYGSGPGTYLFVYAEHHSPLVNQTEFYDTRFDRASSLFLTLLPTVGIAGFVIFFLFLFAIGVRSLVFLIRRTSEDWSGAFAAFIPWSILVLAAGLYHFNVTLMILLFLLSALISSRVLAPAHVPERDHAAFVRFASSVALALGALAFFVGIFFTSQRYVAEIAFAKAVRADREGTPLSEVIGWLDTAATLNRFDDRSYRVLAQALLLRVNEQLQANPSNAELTDESRAYLQALIAAAVNASVRATDLSENNPLNWLMRGTVYRELMNVIPNASTFAIGAFEKATVLEPVNPSNWNELGITYLAAAERERPLTVAENAEVSAQAKALVEDYMKKGEAALYKAIELKANYAPAHYQLSLAYERQGRLDDAIGKLESVARYNPQDVGVAFQLGQLYLRRSGAGDAARAKEAFGYAITLAPSYSNARWFLASIFEQEGNVNAAIEQIEKVLELNPKNELVKARLDRLLKGQTSTETPVPLP